MAVVLDKFTKCEVHRPSNSADMTRSALSISRPGDLDFSHFELEDSAHYHRRENRGDRGDCSPQLLGWGTNKVLVPNFLAV